MNKRKIDLNQLKKNSVKGKKYRNIQVKYQIVLSYFKQKQVKEMKIFQVHFFPLIQDILNQLSNAQIIFKLQQNNQESLRSITNLESNIKLQTFYLKGLSKQYPIHEICQCLYVQKGTKQSSMHLGIQKNKLMVFFKKLRLIYSDFCYCIGEKFILQPPELKFFYQLFKSEWSKSEQKGRLSQIQKLEKRLCRSLFFLGVLIQNNIYEAIELSQKKRMQETAEIGTKSEKKKNIKGINQNVSSTYSFGSTDLVSNFSVRLKSQKSNQEDGYLKNYYIANPYSQYSQKSQKIVSKSKFGLWDKAQIKSLKFKIEGQGTNTMQTGEKFEINYLSNDVENILIEQAFKIRKFQDSCLKNDSYSNQNPYYCLPYPYQAYEAYDYSQTMSQNAGYNVYNNYNYGNINDTVYNNDASYQGQEVNQLRRSFDFFNLVQTRKNPHRFTAKKTSNQNKYE